MMPDRDMIIRGCEYWIKNHKGEQLILEYTAVEDLLVLLKEQNAMIEHVKRPDCEHAEHDGTGCLGYCYCGWPQDDEPIEECKRCEKYTGNISDGR